MKKWNLRNIFMRKEPMWFCQNFFSQGLQYNKNAGAGDFKCGFYNPFHRFNGTNFAPAKGIKKAKSL